MAIFAIFVSVSGIQAQNVTTHEVVFDTLNISLSDNLTNSHGDIFIGRMRAYDPEGKPLEFLINSQEYKDLFEIDSRGTIKADYRKLSSLCAQEEFLVEVAASDGVQFSIGTVVIYVLCK